MGLASGDDAKFGIGNIMDGAIDRVSPDKARTASSLATILPSTCGPGSRASGNAIHKPAPRNLPHTERRVTSSTEAAPSTVSEMALKPTQVPENRDNAKPYAELNVLRHTVIRYWHEEGHEGHI
jgi:hypothetical protein